MKNMFGEEKSPEKLSFKMVGRVMEVTRGDKFAGYVAKNGWTGKSMFINFKRDEPVLHCFMDELSFTDLKELMGAWEYFHKI